MDIVNEPLPTIRHTVGFSRKKNLGNYESVDASIFLQFETHPDTPLGEIISEAQSMWDVAAAAVFERLDLPYEIDPETGVVTEDKSAAAAASLEAAFAAPAAAPTERKVGPNAVGVGEMPPFPENTDDKSQRRANATWAKARFETHPSEFFDNRADKANGTVPERRPDIKHRKSGVAAWF